MSVILALVKVAYTLCWPRDTCTRKEKERGNACFFLFGHVGWVCVLSEHLSCYGNVVLRTVGLCELYTGNFNGKSVGASSPAAIQVADIDSFGEVSVAYSQHTSSS